MAFMNKKKTLFLLILLCLSVCICVAQDDDFIDVFDDNDVEIEPSVKLEESKSSSLKQEQKPKPEIKKNASETEKIRPERIFSCPGVVPNEGYFRNKENMRRRREEFLKKYASETIDVNQSAFETKKLENSNSNDEKFKTEDMDDFGLYDIDEEVEFDNN